MVLFFGIRIHSSKEATHLFASSHVLSDFAAAALYGQLKHVWTFGRHYMYAHIWKYQSTYPCLVMFCNAYKGYLLVMP